MVRENTFSSQGQKEGLEPTSTELNGFLYHITKGKGCAFEIHFRADELDVNKWKGILNVLSKGEECIIKLEDKSSGELYARTFLRGEPHPVEYVIDSNEWFSHITDS
ncbi:hypothetical protein VIGAN_06132400 [Vigna angularis var. angularis]|uniref:NECAP PHear domain-containing protein n=1 Tax=Vigna angularis var. angularis TaxID=157739 RepID=A0A0S3SBC5_PHAAN|nr:hypothetical protein VIGAN_06132400 [Vigna angularis var. angularis]